MQRLPDGADHEVFVRAEYTQCARALVVGGARLARGLDRVQSTREGQIRLGAKIRA